MQVAYYRDLREFVAELERRGELLLEYQTPLTDAAAERMTHS